MKQLVTEAGALQKTFEITNNGVLDLTLTSPYVSLSGSLFDTQ